MSLFTSNRERRLWFWALAVLAAIYATLGLAGKLAGYLREQNLLGIAFGLGLLLAVGAVIAQWVKRRPGRGEIWVALGVAAVYFMAWVRVENPAERTHLFEYGLVAVFIYEIPPGKSTT
jgi:drug/metabolite transporter (DMT)-like permease